MRAALIATASLFALLFAAGGAHADPDVINRVGGTTQMKASTVNNPFRAETRPPTATALKPYAGDRGVASIKHQSAASVNMRRTQDLKSGFRSQAKDREAQDKLGNFEIQTHMSDRNRAETLGSSVQKKTDNTVRGCKNCF